MGRITFDPYSYLLESDSKRVDEAEKRGYFFGQMLKPLGGELASKLKGRWQLDDTIASPTAGTATFFFLTVNHKEVEVNINLLIDARNDVALDITISMDRQRAGHFVVELSGNIRRDIIEVVNPLVSLAGSL